jgi:hypothetical protein
LKPGDLVSGSTFLWNSPHDYEDVKFLCATFECESYLIVETQSSVNHSGDFWVKVLYKSNLGWGLGSDMRVIRKFTAK